jgi:hypothetical protein
LPFEPAYQAISKLLNDLGTETELLKIDIVERLRDEKRFDSAIVSKAEPDSPAKPKAAVALVPDDILSAVGSKFFPVPVAKATEVPFMDMARRKSLSSASPATC